MAILITGGMGHVGYELIKHALRAGEDVIAQYHTTFRKKDAELYSLIRGREKK